MSHRAKLLRLTDCLLYHTGGQENENIRIDRIILIRSYLYRMLRKSYRKATDSATEELRNFNQEVIK